jgi:hypothetical protein
MILKYAYFWIVKERLNLTIDGVLLEAMKAYAASKRMSVSELVEDYFRSATRPVERKNIVEMMDELAKPVLDRRADLKELFYRQQEEKYGF